MTFKPEYNYYQPYVNYINDVYNGTTTVLKHLRKFELESDEEYKGRQSEAVLINYTKQTIQAMRNIIFRKPVDTELITNPSLQKILDTIDLENTLNDFARRVTVNAIRDGFTWILAENFSNGNVRTRADELAMGIRPYLVLIPRANVVNWKEDGKGGYEWVIIREYISTWTGFDEKIVEDYKVFYPDRVDVYREGKIVNSIETNLGRVPIVKVGKEDIPDTYDLAKLNVQHFNRSSEVNHYVRMASVPITITYQMPMDENGEVKLGTSNGLNFDAPRQEAGLEIVSLEAKNTSAIEGRIAKIEEQALNMAVNFATSSRVKTATQVDKEATQDESRLVYIADVVEDGLIHALQMLALYDPSLELSEDQYPQINRDYDNNILTPEQVNMHLMLYREGVISLDMFWDALEKGEVITIDDRDKQKQLLADSGL